MVAIIGIPFLIATIAIKNPKGDFYCYNPLLRIKAKKAKQNHIQGKESVGYLSHLSHFHLMLYLQGWETLGVEVIDPLELHNMKLSAQLIQNTGAAHHPRP